MGTELTGTAIGRILRIKRINGNCFLNGRRFVRRAVTTSNASRTNQKTIFSYSDVTRRVAVLCDLCVLCVLCGELQLSEWTTPRGNQFPH